LWELLLVPGEIEPARAVLARQWTRERPGHFVNHWLTKTGERRWIAWSNTVTKGAEGRPLYLIMTGIDRTESERAEDGGLLAKLGAALADTLYYGETMTRIASLLVLDLADF